MNNIGSQGGIALFNDKFGDLILQTCKSISFDIW